MENISLVPPFGSSGGKFNVRKQIVNCLPEHRIYVESFGGSAAVLYAKSMSEVEVLNDLDEEIYFAHNFIKNITQEQIAELRKRNWISSKRHFLKLRDERPTKDLDRIYRFLYLKHASYARTPSDMATFSYGFEGKNVGACLDRLELCALRLNNVEILNKQAIEVIEKYDAKDSIQYIDPPYEKDWQENQGTKEFDLNELVDCLKSLKGKFLLSYENTEKARELLKSFEVRKLQFIRRMQLAPTKGQSYKDYELLIANYELPKRITKAIIDDFVGLLRLSENLSKDFNDYVSAYDQNSGELPQAKVQRLYTNWINELPEKIIKVAGEELDPSEEGLTREEQRELLQEQIGDFYIVVENGKKHRFVIQYHVRGIWSKDDVKRIKQELQDAKTQDELDTVWNDNDCAYLKTSLEELSKEAQKVDDERGDVSAIVKKHLMDEVPELKDLDLAKVFNKGNVHIDFRNEEPEGRYLIGWTCDVGKVVLQNLDDELYFPLRNRFLENEGGDNWLSQRKSGQPLSWLTIVNPKREVWEAEPERVGATRYTSGRFIFKASGQVVFGVAKGDYLEYFLFFDQDEYKHLNGRFDWKLIPSRKEYTKAPEKQFWMGSRPWKTQTPYILTHDREEEEAKAKKDKIEMVWNDKTIDVLRELKYEHLDEEVGKIMFEMPIIKVLADKQIAIGPLLVPNRIDAQNDFATPEDIEDAAHKCLEMGPDIKLMHEGKPIDAVAVESAIYRNYDLPEGSWIGAVKIKDKAIWNLVKSGKLRGFSIGGTGARQKVKIKR